MNYYQEKISFHNCILDQNSINLMIQDEQVIFNDLLSIIAKETESLFKGTPLLDSIDFSYKNSQISYRPVLKPNNLDNRTINGYSKNIIKSFNGLISTINNFYLKFYRYTMTCYFGDQDNKLNRLKINNNFFDTYNQKEPNYKFNTNILNGEHQDTSNIYELQENFSLWNSGKEVKIDDILHSLIIFSLYQQKEMFILNLYSIVNNENFSETDNLLFFKDNFNDLNYKMNIQNNELLNSEYIESIKKLILTKSNINNKSINYEINKNSDFINFIQKELIFNTSYYSTKFMQNNFPQNEEIFNSLKEKKTINSFIEGINNNQHITIKKRI